MIWWPTRPSGRRSSTRWPIRFLSRSSGPEMSLAELSRSTAEAPTVASIAAGELHRRARSIDEEGLYPADIMRALGGVGAFAHHHTPRGLFAAISAMADVGAICGSTGFCMWCQDALVWYLANSENPLPRERHLDDVAAGRQLGGTGLSNPMKALAGIERLALKGKRVPGGYRITGRLPFVSNVENGHLFAGVFQIEGETERLGMAIFRAGHEGVALAR